MLNMTHFPAVTAHKIAGIDLGEHGFGIHAIRGGWAKATEGALALIAVHEMKNILHGGG
jgi:hypothetical protein